MTWGPLFMYYICPECGLKYKYELGRLTELGNKFGCCPKCGIEGRYIKEGPVVLDDNEFLDA